MKGGHFTGTVWRHIPDKHPETKQTTSAVHGGKILDADGRWNVYGVFGALYTALSRRGALEEYKKYVDNKFPFAVEKRGYGFTNHVLVDVTINVKPVLELTDSGTRHRYDVTMDHIKEDSPSALSTCQRTAYKAHTNGYNAILVPSSPNPDETNLVIYSDGLARNIHYDDGGTRIPIDDDLLKENDVI